MAEQIGELYPTQVPSLSDVADIQEALRLYHYGAPTGTGVGEYDINNVNLANLVNPSIAYTLNNLQSQITSLSSLSSIPVSAFTIKGGLIVGTGSGTYTQLNPGANGRILSANSSTASGLEWVVPEVTATNTVTLTNKTLTSPVITASTNAQTDNYTLVLSDANKYIEVLNSSAKTITVPTNTTAAFPIGTEIHIVQTSTGQISVSGADISVTINATPGLKLRAQWSTATLRKRDTNTWLLMGDLSA